VKKLRIKNRITLNYFREYIFRKRNEASYLPTIEDINNKKIRELSERLRGKLDKETLVNILEWQNHNITYWRERAYLDLLVRFVTLPLFLIFVIFVWVTIPLIIVLYIIFLKLFANPMIALVFSLIIGISWLGVIIKANRAIKLLYVILFSYPIYCILQIIILNTQEPKVILDILNVSIINWTIFGISIFVLAYLSIIYCPLLRYEESLTKKVKKLMDLILDTFELSISVEKILEYRLAICRDYAKLTAAILYNIYPNNDIYFYCIPGHVACGIKINNKIYILDQKLPIFTQESWLKIWSKGNIEKMKHNLTIYKMIVKNDKIKIEKTNNRNIKISKKENKDIMTKEIEELLNSLIKLKNKNSNKNKQTLEILLPPIRGWGYYCENDEIVKYSLIRMLMKIIKNEFCENIDRISKISCIQDKKDLILKVYYK